MEKLLNQGVQQEIVRNDPTCQYQHPLTILNQGVHTTFCTHFFQSVNDDICRSCPDKCGTRAQKVMQVDFPRRSDEEIALAYGICQQCPLFEGRTKTCKKDPHAGHPTDILAQNPAYHCPEGHW